jgi:hypothetical protein
MKAQKQDFMLGFGNHFVVRVLLFTTLSFVSCAPAQSSALLNTARCEHPKQGTASTQIAVYADGLTGQRINNQIVSCLNKLGWAAHVIPGQGLALSLFDGATRGVSVEFSPVQSKGVLNAVTILTRVTVQIITVQGVLLNKQSFDQPGVGQDVIDAMRTAEFEGLFKASLIAHEIHLANP